MSDVPVEESSTACEAVHRVMAGRGRGRKRRWLRVLLGLALALVVVVAGLGYAAFTLQSERNSAFLRGNFLDLVNRAVGPGHEVVLEGARLEFHGLLPRFSLSGLRVRNQHTRGEVQLAEASFALSPWSLWRFSPEARVVRFSELRVLLPDADTAARSLQAQEVLALLRGMLGAVHIVISGEEESFAALKSVEGSAISILRRDERGNTVPLQTGLALHLERRDSIIEASVFKPDGARLPLQARRENGPRGPETVLETLDVDAGTLFSLVGQQVAGIDPALRLNLRMVSHQSENRQLAESVIRISARGGRIVLPDPDMIPFHLDEGVLELGVRPGVAEIEVRRLEVGFNETRIVAHGTLTPLGGAGSGLALRLKADKALLDRLSPQEEVVELDAADLEGEVSADLASFRLDRLDIAEDEGRGRLTGRFSLANGGLVETRFEGTNFPVRKALRIWPVWVAPNVRLWTIDHMKAGQMSSIQLASRLEGPVLADAMAKRPLPDDAISLAFRLENVTLAPLADALPLTNASGSGRVSGRRAAFDIEQGEVRAEGRVLRLKPSKLVVSDTARKPALMEMTLPASGELAALVSYLGAPSLRAITGLPEQLSVSEGSFDGVATLLVPLGHLAQARDARVEMRADLRGVVVRNIVKGENLESGNLTMVSKGGVVSVKGEAKVFGTTGQVDVKVDAKGAQAQVKTTLDDAALAKRGIDLRPSVAGPLGITASLPLGSAEAPVDFEVDLARARINAPVPGIAKPAGQAGRARFSLRSLPTGHSIEGLEADFGTLSLRGKIEVAQNGGFAKADLSTFKLSAGDNARLVAERAGKGYKLNLRGNSFDMRPFLKGVQSGRMEASGTPVDFDLDLATTVLVGFGGELMGGAELKLARRAGQITELNLKGQFSGAPARVTSSLQGRVTQLKVTTEDGGALARFLDLYSRAYGGLLQADVALQPNNVQSGSVQMRDFVLRGEAGLRSVSANAREGQAVVQGTDDVPFSRLRASFARNPGRLEVREAVMWGPQVGGTMEGTLDYAADRVSIKGTFVPAYALNNLFAKLPVLGPILGGGQHEGLFAVPFIITGRASAPDLRVNPVSVIAPGFLRKIFEIRKESQ